MKLADKLKYARKQAGMTLAQVEKKTGIGESSLSDIENAKREPKFSQLDLLARLYGTAVSFFFDDSQPAQEIVLWRERPEGAVEEIETEFLRLCNQYRDLEEWCDDLVPPVLPLKTGARRHIDYFVAEDMADEVRSLLLLGDHPGFSLLRTLGEDWGVKLFHLEYEPSGTAASTLGERFGMAVLLNLKNVRWRRNFDLAHELFHLLTWEHYRKGEGSGGSPGADEEKLAGAFARDLLMPAKPMKDAVGRWMRDESLSDEALFEIAAQFDVSAEAVVWRIYDLYMRPEQHEETREVAERVRKLTATHDKRRGKSDRPPKYPERYRTLAICALNRGEISLGRFAEYMGISRAKAAAYLEQEGPGVEGIHLTPSGR